MFSLALSAMQLLPSMEATKWMLIDARYGLGLKDPWFYLSYVVPNYWAFGMNMPVDSFSVTRSTISSAVTITRLAASARICASIG